MKWLINLGTWVKTHLALSIVFLSVIIVGGVVISVIVINNETNKTKIVLKKNLNFEVNSEVYLISLIKKISDGELLTENHKIDTSKLGKKSIIIKYLDNREKEKKYKFNINIIDNTPPSIEVSTKELSTTINNEIDLLKNVKVRDNSKEDIKVNVLGDYDYSKVGTYNLKYVAIDSSKNKTEEEFILKVNNVTVKTYGVYVNKNPDVWNQLNFNDDGSFSYLPWTCPGSACGGGSFSGTYSISGNKLKLMFSNILNDTGGTFANDDVWYLTINNDNQIVKDEQTYTWQKNNMFEE